MSGQPAEQSEGFTSTDSRLDAILSQLHALGAATDAPKATDVADAPGTPADPATPATPERALRSVPDLPPVTVDDESAAEGRLVPPEVPQPAPAPPPLTEVDVPAMPPIPPMPALVEPPPVPPLPVLPSVSFDEPADTVEIAPVVDVEPVLDEPAPVVVEYHSEREGLVFELDGPLHDEPVDQPTTAVGQPEAARPEMPEMPLESPPPVPPVADTGWVSHHTEVSDVPPESPALDALYDPAFDDSVVGEPSTVEEHVDHADGAMSALVEAQAAVLDVPQFTSGASFESPEWGDVTENPDVVEDVPFSAFNPHASTTAVEEYETDEELPLPDFTGVWDDSSVPSVWDAEQHDASGIPDPVEIPGAGSGIAVGRNELDSLRPSEEEKVVREPAQNLGRKMQLFAVILFGLIALAVVLLNDPAAVDELREIYDGFFG